MQDRSIVKTPDSTWEVLAVLRFFLAIIVVVEHVHIWTSTDFILTQIGKLSAYAAVMGFLIVSGYSIAHSLSRKTEGFYQRRFLRIYPLYVVAIIVPVAIHALRGHMVPHEVSNAVQNLFFLQTYLASPMMVNPVLWSLAVEVACYAAAPWLMRRSTTTLLSIAGVSAAAFMVYPALHLPYYEILLHGGALLFLAWAWLAGFIYHRHRADQKAATALVLITVFLLSVNNAYTQKYYLLTVVMALAAMTFGRSLAIPARIGKLMSYAGDVSFPLYVLHWPIFFFFFQMLHMRSAYVLILGALAAGVGGVIIDPLLRYPMGVVYDFVQNTTRMTGRTVYGVATGGIARTGGSEAVDTTGTLVLGRQ